MYQRGSVENRRDIESGESCFLFEFAQASLATRLMGFDVTSGGTPTEQPMSDEEGVVAVRIEDPCGGTHVASRHDLTSTVVMIES
jgi:hypothetical protein